MELKQSPFHLYKMDLMCNQTTKMTLVISSEAMYKTPYNICQLKHRVSTEHTVEF